MTLIEDCMESCSCPFPVGCLADEVLIILENQGISGSKIVFAGFF